MKKKIARVFIAVLFAIALIGIVWVNYPVLEYGEYYTSNEESIVS